MVYERAGCRRGRSCSARAPGGSRRSATTGSRSARRPACPGKLPFWHGDAVGPADRARAGARRLRRRGRGRPRARRQGPGGGRRRGSASTTTSTSGPPRTCSPTSRTSARSTGALPTDRRIVVERFRDELGDWRLCLLTPFGGRVHAPWSLALEARLAERLGLEVQTIWSDDGIAIRLPEGDATLDGVEALLFPDPDELEDLVVGQLSSVGAVREPVPRERRRGRCCCRAAGPGTRTPLWQQRQRAAGPARGRLPLRLLPDPRRDVSRVPLGRLRPAGAARDPGRRRSAARSRSTRSRPCARVAVREQRCCSTTSPRTCTTATRRWPSAAPAR